MSGPTEDITRLSSQQLIDAVKRNMAKNAQKSEASESDAAGTKVPERGSDSVEIQGSAPTAAEPSADEIKASLDMDKYLSLLSEMPDLREDEVARVEAILEEEGYGDDAISGMLDDLIQDL